MTDNENVYVWYQSLAADTITALNSSRTQDYNPTDLNTFNEDVLTNQTVAIDYDYSGTICGFQWWENGQDGGKIGFSRCMIVVPGGSKCDQNRLDFDNDWMGPGQPSGVKQSLACHEFGHAMGLAHIDPSVTNSCMLDPISGQQHLSGHDIAHITNNYP